jgi:hypothetical protein
MRNREKSRFGRTGRAKAKLGFRKNLISRTEVMEIIKYMTFKDLLIIGRSDRGR